MIVMICKCSVQIQHKQRTNHAQDEPTPPKRVLRARLPLPLEICHQAKLDQLTTVIHYLGLKRANHGVLALAEPGGLQQPKLPHRASLPIRTSDWLAGSLGENMRECGAAVRLDSMRRVRKTPRIPAPYSFG